jgi:23S rRNA pseudouridine2605 synthase
MIADFGIQLPDGKSRLGLERTNDTRRDWIVTMTEGRNRQIRRTFAALGYEVVRLHRTDFGPYKLADLKSGQYIEITKMS